MEGYQYGKIYIPLYPPYWMPGKTRFQILEEILAPFEGQTLHVDKLKLLLVRNLGSSGSTMTTQLQFARDAGLISETEPFKFLIKKLEI